MSYATHNHWPDSQALWMKMKRGWVVNDWDLNEIELHVLGSEWWQQSLCRKRPAPYRIRATRLFAWWLQCRAQVRQLSMRKHPMRPNPLWTLKTHCSVVINNNHVPFEHANIPRELKTFLKITRDEQRSRFHAYLLHLRRQGNHWLDINEYGGGQEKGLL